MMKVFTKLTALMLALLLALPCAIAEDAPAYAPIADWLIDDQPAPAPYPPNAASFLPDDGGYVDDSISITIETTYWTKDIQQVEKPAKGTTTVMAVHVKLTDVSQFRTALARPFPSKSGTRVGHMLTKNNGILGINADYFMYENKAGIIYRNGRELRFVPSTKRDLLIVDQAGDLHTLCPASEENWNAYIANGGTVLHSFFFGPNMVNADGTAVTDFGDVVDNKAVKSGAQRMVIGQVGPLEYLILCTEGPESTKPKSAGFTLYEMSELCAAYGLKVAYNLDGGSSSTVATGEKKLNSPTTYKYRDVGDCIYFATLVPPAPVPPAEE